MWRFLMQPANLILLAANLFPLVGVIFWGWDAFVLLMLYWLETAVIAFWTVARIATMPISTLGDLQFRDASGAKRIGRPIGMAPVLHVARRHLHGRAFPVPVGTVLRRLVAENSRASTRSSIR